MLNSSVALMIVCNSLTWLMHDSSAPLLMVGLLSIILYIISGFRSCFSMQPLPLILVCLIVFAESWIMLGTPPDCWTRYLMFFIGLGIPSMFMARSSFNPYAVMITVCFVSIAVLPMLLGLDKMQKSNNGMLMGFSYGSLKYVCALLFLVFFWKRPHNKTVRLAKIGFAVILAYYLLFYIELASRGALVAILCAAVMYFLISRQESVTKAVLVMAGITALIAVFWDDIILFTQDTLHSMDMGSKALNKIIGNDDLSNGRADISGDALEIIGRSPIIGYGVGAYEALGHTPGYVHNLFLQFLLEGGVIFFAIMSFWVILSFRYIFDRSLTARQRYFTAFLFCSAVVELLFSSYFWGSQCFWLLIGYTMRIRRERKLNDRARRLASIQYPIPHNENTPAGI